MEESRSKDTMEAIFERAIDFEYKVSGIYKEFSKMFSHIPDISSFWLNLSEDEVEHAETLKNIRKSLTREQLLSICDKKVSLKVDIAQRMLTKISLESIKNLDNAYELAHELELSELNTIFKLIASEFMNFREWKQFTVSVIKTHHHKLINFTKNFGDRDWRKEIAVK